jgi:DNA-3-methyladenine glycosylase II
MTRQRTKTPEDQLRRADSVLGAIIDEVIHDNDGEPLQIGPDPTTPPDPNMPTDPYASLVRGIVSQNISGYASRSIYRKLKERYGGRPPSPEEILADDPDEMRVAAGLSRAKTASLRSLAEYITSGELDLDRLPDLPDEEIITKLSTVRGIGRWTAQMYLMFSLQRPDILPVGDVELRRMVERAYGLAGLPTPVELEQIAEPWRPYRTLASVYLWRKAETPAH